MVPLCECEDDQDCPGSIEVCEDGRCVRASCGAPIARGCKSGSCYAGTCEQCGSCPSLFAICEDVGELHRCRCDGTTCGYNGECASAGAECIYRDDFEAQPNLFSVCPDSILSTWEWGEAQQSFTEGFWDWGDTAPCHSGTNCWATGLSTAYSRCELSCIEFPKLDLTGVRGPVDLSFFARYFFDLGWDGATLRFSAAGEEVFVEPEGGWDTPEIGLFDDNPDTCLRIYGVTWPLRVWPGWGLYSLGVGREYADMVEDLTPYWVPVSWTEMHFILNSDRETVLFQDDFSFRLYLMSKRCCAGDGIFVDGGAAD